MSCEVITCVQLGRCLIIEKMFIWLSLHLVNYSNTVWRHFQDSFAPQNKLPLILLHSELFNAIKCDCGISRIDDAQFLSNVSIFQFLYHKGVCLMICRLLLQKCMRESVGCLQQKKIVFQKNTLRGSVKIKTSSRLLYSSYIHLKVSIRHNIITINGAFYQ